jgi:hypothetical protein
VTERKSYEVPGAGLLEVREALDLLLEARAQVYPWAKIAVAIDKLRRVLGEPEPTAGLGP